MKNFSGSVTCIVLFQEGDAQRLELSDNHDFISVFFERSERAAQRVGLVTLSIISMLPKN